MYLFGVHVLTQEVVALYGPPAVGVAWNRSSGNDME